MRKAIMKLSRAIVAMSAVALGLPAFASASTMPPGGGMSFPGAGGTTGVCTINNTKYGKAKFNGMETAFNKAMCEGAQGTFTAGGTASAVFDPTSAGGTTGGTTGGGTSGGSTGYGTHGCVHHRRHKVRLGEDGSDVEAIRRGDVQDGAGHFRCG